MKKHLPLIVVIVIVVVLAGISLFKNKSSKDTWSNEQKQTENKPQEDNTTPSPIPTPENSQANTFSGTLKISDNRKRGNLMLVNKDHAIYLVTSRDYNKLVDKEVTVKINGTLENFSLVDIVEK